MKKSIVIILCIIFILGFAVMRLGDGMGGLGKRIVSVALPQPTGHPVSHGFRALKEHIERKIGDRFVVNIYYSSVMGGNTEAQELLQMGTLDLMQTSGSNLETFDELYKIFGVPYLFSDEAHFRKCMNTPEFIQPIYDCTESKGIKGIRWFANGVNNFYCYKPVHTPADLEGLKIRVQSSEANIKMIQGFGAAAVMLPYGEVYTALQNRVIDGAANPEMALALMRHGEVAPYYARTEHQIFTDMLIANTKFLASLTPDERIIFEEAFDIAQRVQIEEWDKQISDCIRIAKEMGVEFIEVDKKPFMDKQAPVKDALIAGTPRLKSLYDIVQKIK